MEYDGGALAGIAKDQPLPDSLGDSRGVGATMDSIHSATSERASLSEHEPLTSRDTLNCSLQQLVEDINAKRKRDTTLLEEFKKALEIHCSTMYSSMEAAVYNMYEQNSSAIQEKLQELTTVLERIAKQEQELEEFKGALTVLYSDIQNSSH